MQSIHYAFSYHAECVLVAVVMLILPFEVCVRRLIFALCITLKMYCFAYFVQYIILSDFYKAKWHIACAFLAEVFDSC